MGQMRLVEERDDAPAKIIEHAVLHNDHPAGSGGGGGTQCARDCGILGLDYGDTPKTH